MVAVIDHSKLNKYLTLYYFLRLLLIHLHDNNMANYQLWKWSVGRAGEAQNLWPANYAKKMSGL